MLRNRADGYALQPPVQLFKFAVYSGVPLIERCRHFLDRSDQWLQSSTSVGD